MSRVPPEVYTKYRISINPPILMADGEVIKHDVVLAKDSVKAFEIMIKEYGPTTKKKYIIEEEVDVTLFLPEFCGGVSDDFT